MGLTLESILNDTHSGSYALTGNTLDYFRLEIEQCLSEKPDSAQCFSDLHADAKRILAKQPNMALLRRCVNQFFSHFKRILKSGRQEQGILEDTLARLAQIREDLERNLEQISKTGAKLIATSNKVMTISYSTMVEHVLEQANRTKKRFHVFNLKSHPPDEGIRFSEALSGKNIKTTLIADNEMGIFMPEMHLILIGTDRIYEDGFINKSGTLPLCLTAKHFNIPVYLVAETWKILPVHEKAVKFINRDSSEIYSGKYRQLQVENYYLERIPLDLVTKVVCEQGAFETHEFIDWYLKG